MIDHSDFEGELRDRLSRRAASIDAVPAVDGGLLAADEARFRHAARHRRRMVAASAATIAAVAAGLVVVSRDPGQDVSTQTDRPAAAGAGLAAGSATGSTTGSASGSPKGWSGFGLDPRPVPALWALTVDPQLQFSGLYEGAHRRGDAGDLAADIAVAADARPGAPLRFIVASVQDSARLTSGKGGTEVTINGRTARVISRRASTVITWDMSAEQRVLLTVAGVDGATLSAWLGSLVQDESGQWHFAAGTSVGGLAAIETTTPHEQGFRSMSWQRWIDPATPCDSEGIALSTNTGGAYELWGRIAEDSRWSTTLPTVGAALIGASPAPVVTFATEWSVSALIGDDVVTISPFSTRDAKPVVPPIDLMAMLTKPADWAAVTEVQPQAPSRTCERDDIPEATMPPSTAVDAGE